MKSGMRKIKLLILIISCFTIFLNNFAQEIEIRKTQKGGYQLFVEGRPFLIKGVIYNPTPIGKGYDYDLFSDENHYIML